MRPDKLRFDFTHPQQLTDEERERVQHLVNEKVFENLPVRTFVTPIEEARTPRRDDALRREVRRSRARRRDRRLLARALRRNARPIDGGDRPVRDPLARARSGPARGASKRSPPVRRMRISTRRMREADELACGARTGTQGVAETEARGCGRLRDRREGRRRRARPRRSRSRAASCATSRTGCASRRRRPASSSAPWTTGAPISSSISTSRSSAAASTRRSSCASIGRHIGGGGGGRPTLAEAGGKNPGGLRDALEAGKQAIAAALEVKVLALDYGRARTGVAVSDPTGTIARPLCVVESAATGDGLARLATLDRRSSEVERVVVGMPLTLRGERGEQATRDGALRRGAERRDRAFRSSRSTSGSRPTSPSRRPPTRPRTRALRPICCPATSHGRAAPGRNPAAARAPAGRSEPAPGRAAPRARARRARPRARRARLARGRRDRRWRQEQQQPRSDDALEHACLPHRDAHDRDRARSRP